MIVFATLGPGGTNHELVTRRYIAFHGLDDAQIRLVDDFDQAVDLMRRGKVDYIVQCAVHPDTPRTMGLNFRDIFACDTFISPSKDLAILTRVEVDRPHTLGLIYPATSSYVDVSRWSELEPIASIPYILDALLEGRIDSGLVYLEYAARHADRLRIDEVIGSPDDAWIVYGRERTYREGVQACRSSPIAELLKRSAPQTA
jgi:hypothetical protein